MQQQGGGASQKLKEMGTVIDDKTNTINYPQVIASPDFTPLQGGGNGTSRAFIFIQVVFILVMIFVGVMSKNGTGGSNPINEDVSLLPIVVSEPNNNTVNTDIKLANDISQRRYGMTWGVGKYDNSNNITKFGCREGGKCDAYQGDTDCTEELPLLCVKEMNYERPDYVVSKESPGVMPNDFYNGRFSAVAKFTTPIQGSSFITIGNANSYCEEVFGDGYRVGEFHDGNGGRGFFVSGSYSTITSRFWIHIDDQPSTCWGNHPNTNNNQYLLDSQQNNGTERNIKG